MDEYNLPLNFLRHRDDAERYHIIAYDDLTGRPIGTGCIHRDGHVGRIAILHSQHKTTSVAHVIVDYLMHVANALKLDRVWLNAPIDTLDFYDYRDFHPMGDSFEFCGLPMQKLELLLEAEQHNKMQRILKQPNQERPTNVFLLH